MHWAVFLLLAAVATGTLMTLIAALEDIETAPSWPYMACFTMAIIIPVFTMILLSAFVFNREYVVEEEGQKTATTYSLGSLESSPRYYLVQDDNLLTCVYVDGDGFMRKIELSDSDDVHIKHGQDAAVTIKTMVITGRWRYGFLCDVATKKTVYSYYFVVPEGTTKYMAES